MCGPVRVNRSGFFVSAPARRQSAGRSRPPSPISPKTTPDGRARNAIPGSARNLRPSSRVIVVRTFVSGRTKYPIMPLVSGWFTSNR